MYPLPPKNCVLLTGLQEDCPLRPAVAEVAGSSGSSSGAPASELLQPEDAEQIESGEWEAYMSRLYTYLQVRGKRGWQQQGPS